jgi:hypothetical protein
MKQISVTKESYIVAVKAAKRAVSGFIGLDDEIKKIFHITPEIEDAAKVLSQLHTQRSIATAIHADIANFAYAQCQVVQKETVLDIYTKLSRELPADAVLQVQKVLGIKIDINTALA